MVKGVAVVLPPSLEERAPRVRRHLSADALYELLRLRFEKIPDHRGRQCPISLTDAQLSAFAMFSLKDPSLLAFEERRNDENLRNLFRISDPIKPSTPEAIRTLHRLGLQVIMLTGDNENTARTVADALGSDRFEAGINPQEKNQRVKSLRSEGRVVAMAGDGINRSSSSVRRRGCRGRAGPPLPQRLG